MQIYLAIVVIVVCACSHAQLWYDGNIFQVAGRILFVIGVLMLLLTTNSSDWFTWGLGALGVSTLLGIAGMVSNKLNARSWD